MKATDCSCDEPGWCQRHRCFKSWHWLQICRRSADYFEQWERSQGPNQHDHPVVGAGPRTDCRHRGGEVQRIECPTCRGNVQIKIFACEMHVKCVIAGLNASIANCSQCDDYQEQEPRQQRA